MDMLRNRRGATLLGYGLIVGLVAVVALSSIKSGGDAVNNLMTGVSDSLQTGASGGAAVSEDPSPTPTPPTFAVWDPPSLTISGDGAMTLSNGDRTATRTGDSNTSDSWGRSHSDRYMEGDQGYFEITVDTFPSWSAEYNTHLVEIGVLVTNTVSHQIILNGGRGYYWQNSGNNVDPNHYYAEGAVIGIAVDRAAGKIWFTRNGSTWNVSGGNPSTGALGTNASVFSFTPGSSIRARTLMMANNNSSPSIGPQVTLNAGQEPFVYSVPSGFDGRLTSPTP
ncbi:MAG: hypothetical protein Alpg2KO_04540 [Alphaproteobacteria bacterium]